MQGSKFCSGETELQIIDFNTSGDICPGFGFTLPTRYEDTFVGFGATHECLLREILFTYKIFFDSTRRDPDLPLPTKFRISGDPAKSRSWLGDPIIKRSRRPGARLLGKY